MLLPDATEVSSGQLKRFNESVIDPKYSMKVEVTSFSFNSNLFFSSNIIFSCILLFLFEKYGLHAFQNNLELQSTLSFSKYCNLAYSFRFATKFRCRLNLTMSLRFFELFALCSRRALVIICDALRDFGSVTIWRLHGRLFYLHISMAFERVYQMSNV